MLAAVQLSSQTPHFPELEQSRIYHGWLSTVSLHNDIQARTNMAGRCRQTTQCRLLTMPPPGKPHLLRDMLSILPYVV